MPTHLLRWCCGGYNHGRCGVQMPLLTKFSWAGWRNGRCRLWSSEKLEGQWEVLVVAMHACNASACHWAEMQTPLALYQCKLCKEQLSLSQPPNAPDTSSNHVVQGSSLASSWEWWRVWFPKSSSIWQQQAAAAPGKKEAAAAAAAAAWALNARQCCQKVSCTVGRRRRPLPQKGARVREEAWAWIELMRTCACARVH